MRANLGPEKQLTLTEIHWIGEGNAKRWPSMRNSLGELLSLKVFYDVWFRCTVLKKKIKAT